MRTQLPVLAGGALAVTGQPAPIPAGSATWFAWLDEPATRTFAFRDAAGSFTARKERKQRGGDYWVAYRKRDGKLQKHYLGKSADLTLERLLRAAQALMVTPAPAQHVPPTPPRATPLLRAKLFAPPARADLVPRPQLWGLLDQSVHTRLVLVAAPAGFGKSTLLSQWSASSPAERRPLAPDRAFAWLTLDATDNDPIQFLRYVVMALQGIAPGLGVAALALLEVDHGRSLPASPVDALTALANDLTTLPGHTWLVLDDYHAVHDRAVHAALAFLLDHLPPQLHIVLATREDPPLPLARLRARREITELRAADLRFTSAETGTFLCERMRLPLAAAEVAALDTRTEGWIAGLQLAALALQQRSDYASFVAGFTGSHRFVMEYLVEDVLARLPAHIQRFLLHTSILTQLSAPLCAAVLGDVGGDLAQALLEELERGNVFVVPLDDERSLYRYHHLFADAVRSQLQHLAAPGERDRLHARAAAWLAANGQPAEAIRHAFAAHDEGWACDLIEGQVLPALLQGLGATVAGWLDAVPEATQLTRPRLLLAQVWLALVRADYVAVTQRLAEAEAALVARGAPSEQQGELAGTRAMVAGLLNDPVAVQYGIAALGQLPPDHPLRPTVALMLGYVYLSAGDLAGADQTLLRTMGAEAPDPRFFADRATLLAVLGMVRRAQGRLSAGAQLCADALALVRQGAQLKPLAGACLALMTVATIEYERNNVDTADEQLRLCRELGRQCGMAIADILGQFYSTPIMAARGDIPGAVALLDRTLEQAHEQGSPPATIREIEGYRALLWLRQGQPERAAQWAAQQAATPRPPLTPYDYDRFALVRLLMAEARWDAAEQALADLLERAQTTGHRRFEVWARVLGAALGHARGAPDDALAHLAAALELAEPEGYIRMFVDEGQSIAALLQRYAARRGAHALYARRILAAFPRAEAPAADPLVEPLTAREREVLLRIAAGASNQEIADQLIITVGTVKKYVHAICGKLGVQRRTQAVAEARALGLL